MNTSQSIFPFHIFRAYDIRGKVELLGPQLIYAIAHALADQLRQQGQMQVVIGYDARLTSPQYAEIIAAVFSAQGFQVTEMGCCSTPQMYFAARQSNGNGIMVTASHNPKTDNGIKWIVQAEPPSPEMIQQIAQQAYQFIQQTAVEIELPSTVHQTRSEFCQSYQHALCTDIQLNRPLRVVIDGLSGSAGCCGQGTLQRLGCEVTALRCHANGHFPDHAPDPSQAIHLTELRKQVLLQQADIGIALDGDGDRVVLVDEKGHIISADRLLSLFAQICLKDHPNHEVVFDVKCSSMVRQTVEALSGQASMIRTGSSFLRKYLSRSEGRAVFGGEYAGHYVFNDGRGMGYDDGLYAALRVMEYLSQLPGTTLSEVLSVYPERCHTEDTYISTYSTDPATVLNEIEHSGQQTGAKLSRIDGIRLDFKNGFGIIRASNTGEFFTVRFDADSPSGLNEIRHTFVSMLRDRYPMIAQDILNAQ
ncbi:phosphomannomutase/phosphoglucomutase [Acinetobacter sp. WZC-1]|uniref:phosphomannomutase/phosphoglucomutase n=1 Tax=Acinetobacter sp. WZC-1 TaxID=3459034 RepID=UPI00403DAE72